MFKRLIAGIMIVMFMAVGAWACILTDGSKVYVFTPDGMLAGQVPGDQEVVLLDKQPPAEILMSFGLGIGEDWSDGVAVFDEKYNVTSLVHVEDLEGECGIE